ncbi:MAG: T9SS type A sorting domain-containing protein [Bacteroidia bacterium]
MGNSIRQSFALAFLCLFATATQAQFQNLYSYVIPGGANGAGIYKDVKVIENQPANATSIVTVGSDNQAPPRGVIAYKDANGAPLNFRRFNIAGATVDGMAICTSPGLNVIACFYDATNRATEVVSTNQAGTVINWRTRIPNFCGRDIVCSNLIAGNNVYLTGNTTPNGANPNVAAVSLTEAAGGLNWYREYDLPAAQYGTTIGHEIAWVNGVLQPSLTVAGRADVIGCKTGVLVLRINANTGVSNWVKVHYDPQCAYDIIGKALVRAIGGANWAIGLEYNNGAGAVYPGVLEVNNAGGYLNGNYFPGGGAFFNSNAFNVEGIDTDGQSYLLSGSFAIGRSYGYTLGVNAALNAAQFNEYETTGLFFPNTSTNLVDLDFSAGLNGYVFGGNFRPAAGDAAWPIWPTPVAFWLIRSNVNGQTPCTTNFNQQGPGLAPWPLDPVDVEIARQLGQTQIANDNPVHVAFPQCDGGGGGNGKTTMSTAVQLDATQPSFTYSDASKQIIARVPADLQGSMSLSLIDMQGRVLNQLSLAAGEHRIDASQLSTGIYFLRYEAAGLTAGTQKVLVR